ncbi:MAG: ectoine synthase [Sandaracinaceae bacterium]
MIVRRLSDALGTDRDVKADTWNSRRLLLSADGMGFSLHDTILHAGTTTRMHYKHHLEAVYCIEGRGTLEDLESGETHPIEPGTVYALNGHERHVLRAESRLRMVCVFNPPVRGDETHGPDGAYPPPEADG